MFYKKIKYVVFILLILSFVIPAFSYALNTESIYVWSNNISNQVTTQASIVPSLEEQQNSLQTER